MATLIAAIVFDWTISLGQIVNAVLVVTGAAIALIKLFYGIDRRVTAMGTAIDKRLTILENDLVDHTKTLADHATRMERWEATLFKIVGDLQRVIGRMEMWDGETERRKSRGK
jgi:hypothetical protein